MVHFVGISFVYGLLDWLLATILPPPPPHPLVHKIERQRFAEIAIGVSLQSFYYNNWHSVDDREESINMVTPQTHVTIIDVDLEEPK